MSGLCHVSIASEFIKNKEREQFFKYIIHIFSERCSLAPTGPVDGISSYIHMNTVNLLLCISTCLLIGIMNAKYDDLVRDYFDNSHRRFYMLRNTLIFFTIPCVFNQLISAFSCRSIKILYDIRFTSAIVGQIGGFFLCLLLAFLLGIKYALLNHLER